MKKISYDGKDVYTINTIYNRMIWFTFGESDSLFERFEDIEPDNGNSYASTQNAFDKQTGLGGILIRFFSAEGIKPEYVAHEAAHAAINIMDFVTSSKIHLSTEDTFGTESFCYLVTDIVKHIMDVIDGDE